MPDQQPSTGSSAVAEIEQSRLLSRLASIEVDFSESDRSLISNFNSHQSAGDDLSISERSGDTTPLTPATPLSPLKPATSKNDDAKSSDDRTANSTISTSPSARAGTFQYRRNPSSFLSSESTAVNNSPPARPPTPPFKPVSEEEEERQRTVSASSLSVENDAAVVVDDASEEGSEERDSIGPLRQDSFSIRPQQDPVSNNDWTKSAIAAPEDDHEDVLLPPRRAGSENSRVSFGPARNLLTDSIQGGDTIPSRESLLSQYSLNSLNLSNSSMRNNREEPAVATAVAAMSDTDDDTLDYPRTNNMSHSLVEYHPDSNAHPPPPAETVPAKPSKKKGVLRNKGKTGPIKRKGSDNRLTKISAMYDLDGDGVLDEVEQAMRDRDIDGDGQLDTAEIYKIVQDQLKSQKDVHLYRKVVAGLCCLVFILALSNFGTSWASAILARDTVADTETSTIQSKKSHEVMGLNQVAHEIDLEPLTDEEFEERRLLVDREMEEDPDHEDHIHRRLGRKDKTNVCTCTKVSYDHAKVKESDLNELIRKCDGVNTVSIKRKWKNGDWDVDTICGPGTNVVKKGKRKNNKKKTKTKVVEDQVKFRRKGKKGNGNGGDRDQEIVFDCKNGYCYGSGQTLLQQEGHPCDLSRDRDGAGECDDGLTCYDPDGDNYGTGTCTRLVKFARKNQVCDIDFGVDACETGYACYSTVGIKRSRTVGVVNTGKCQKLTVRVSNQDVCDASYGNDACDTGYTCIGENGRELNGWGIGYCQKLAIKQRSGGLCDLSLGRDACDDGFYCRDTMLARSGGGNGAGGAVGHGGYAGTTAFISGPSGTLGAGNAAGGAMAVRGRSVGTGTCARTAGRGGRCESHDECGWNGNCVGLGADTSTGGVIRGASGTIVWGTGGATTGICG